MGHRRLDLHTAHIPLVPSSIGHSAPRSLDLVFATHKLVCFRHTCNDGRQGGDCSGDRGVVRPRKDVGSWDDGRGVEGVREEAESCQTERRREELLLDLIHVIRTRRQKSPNSPRSASVL